MSEPDPPRRIDRIRSWMELLVDRDGVVLADPNDVAVGFPPDEPLARLLSAGRSETRDL